MARTILIRPIPIPSSPPVQCLGWLCSMLLLPIVPRHEGHDLVLEAAAAAAASGQQQEGPEEGGSGAGGRQRQGSRRRSQSAV